MDVPPADRGVLLERETGGDSDLRAEVQSLLDAHEQPGHRFDTVTHQFRYQSFAASSAANSRIGERVGAYRIEGVLGSGGMGDVFRAVRDDDQYRAEVAIKLMRGDVRSSLTEQRFRTERQILAGLDHRNIARLLDGGTSASGMPYVVMELVAGEPIDLYCESRNLDVRDRVRLFLQVCAAVSYAHRHLVVHRDLKPTNILVTTEGSVKLLDFGIAKLLEADADTAVAQANATETTLRAMTLDYASPEQVGGGLVTTVSDVYSLGVVLYRLLTGQSPYGTRVNDAQRMQEILSDTTPTRPSVVKSAVDGDLDTILLMALRKEPQHRYGSVEQFANDLRNYLAGMPVHARGNSLRYRAGKFLRRRKGEIAVSLLVAFALLGAVFFSMREARIAQQHFDSVRKLANTLLFDIHDEIAKVPGSIKSREILVKTSLEYLDSLYQGAGADLELQQELAAAYRKVAQIQGSETSPSTGDYQGSLQSYARAITLLEAVAAADPGNQRVAVDLARSCVERAQLMLVVSNPRDALVLARKGIALAEAVAPSMADEAARTELFRAAYTAQGDILFALKESDDAVASFEKVIAVTEQYWRAHPDEEAALFMLSRGLNNAAIHADPRLAEDVAAETAIALLRRVVSADEQLVKLDSQNPRYKQRLANSRHNLARQLSAIGRHVEALPLFRLAATAEAQRAEDPNDRQAQYGSALMHSALGGELLKADEIDEAEALLLRSAEALRRLVAEGNTLRIEYAYGQNAVRLGQLYTARALSSGEKKRRASYWRLALGHFEQATVSLKKVTSAVAIERMDYRAVTDAASGLSRAQQELTGLAPAPTR